MVRGVRRDAARPAAHARRAGAISCARCELAEQLGGRAVTLSGQSVADELLAYAREHNVTRIVIGKPARPRWRERLRGVAARRAGPRERRHRRSSPSPAPRKTRRQPRPSAPPPPRPSSGREYLAAAGIVVVPTGVGHAGPARRRGSCRRSTRRCSTCWPCVVAASRFRRGPALVASLVGIASFDFFFVHPFYTFSVADVRYVLTFGVMLVVALVMGNLTGRIRNQAEAARAREQRTSALYGLSRELATARDRDAVAAAALRSLRDTFALRGGGAAPGRGRRGGRRRHAALPARRARAGGGTVELRPRAGGGARHPHASRPRARCTCRLWRRADAWACSASRCADPADFRDPARRRLLELARRPDRGGASSGWRWPSGIVSPRWRSRPSGCARRS